MATGARLTPWQRDVLLWVQQAGLPRLTPAEGRELFGRVKPSTDMATVRAVIEEMRKP